MLHAGTLLAGCNSAQAAKALYVLLVDRNNEFRELAAALFLNIPYSMTIPNRARFVINSRLDAEFNA